MRQLKDVLLYAGDKVLNVIYGFETTQNTRNSDRATLHVPDIVCMQQFCSRCEDAEYGDCVRSGKRKQSFWDHPVGDMLSYLREQRLWANKVFAIAHNVKSFHLHSS